MNKNRRILCAFSSLIMCTTLSSCVRAQHNDELPLRGERAIYIQARDEDKLKSGEFGDLWMFDFKMNKAYRLTDDEYYDESPLWFPDGKSVFFLSNRVGSWSALKVKGIDSPHEMYRLWIETKKIERIDEQLERVNPSIISGSYESLQWHPDSNSLLFTGFGNIIYRLSLRNDSAWVMVNLDSLLRAQGQEIRSFTISPDTNIMVLRSEIISSPTFRFTTGIYRFSLNKIKALDGFTGIPVFGGWSENGRMLLITYRDSIFELDTKIDSVETVFASDSINAVLGPAYYMGEKSIIFLGGQKKNEDDMSYRRTELLEYDLSQKRLKYLTNDGKYRSSLNVIMH